MLEITKSIKLMTDIRSKFGKLIRYYDLEALNKIPDKFNNNLIWNYGHVLATHQRMTYALCGLPSPMSESLIDMYKKGTRPERDVSQDEVNQLLSLSDEHMTLFKKDYQEGKFENYKPFTSGLGNEISNINDAIEFNNVHEAMHISACIYLGRFAK